jgi:vacuolar iron transporter family protein
MLEIYEEAGVSREDSYVILSTMAKYKPFFVKHMMIMELGLLPPHEDDNPWAHGAVSFASFVAFGSIPLISYVISIAAGAEGDLLFGL